MSPCNKISLRPLLLFLGLLIPMCTGLPYAIGLVYFALHPSKAVEDWPGVLISIFFMSLGGITGWRWWRLGARFDEKEVLMRGLLRTIRLPLADIQRLSLETKTLFNPEGSNTKSQHYVFRNTIGDRIGIMPSSLGFCTDFKSFVSSLRLAISDGRKTKCGIDQKPGLEGRDVDEWTIEDIEKYEKDN